MIDRDLPDVSVVHQCELLDISRSSVYYSSSKASQHELKLMRLIDEQYLRTPFYGSRKMVAWLRSQGYSVNRKRVQRLMRRMGIEAIFRRPRTTKADSGHEVYPYLLRNLQIDKVNQVWAADITYFAISLRTLSPASVCLSSTGAVTISAFIWLMAWVEP